MNSRKKRVLKYLSFIVVILLIYIVGVQTGHKLGSKQALVKHTLAQPNMDSAQILVWANEAAVTILDMNYMDYQQQMQRSSTYFTKQGWQLYVTALKESQQLDSIIKNRLVMTAVASGTPSIMTEGVHEGVYSWKVVLPMLVTYASSSSSKQEHLKVSILIKRTQKYEGLRGVGILSFVSAVAS